MSADQTLSRRLRNRGLTDALGNRDLDCIRQTLDSVASTLRAHDIEPSEAITIVWWVPLDQAAAGLPMTYRRDELYDLLRDAPERFARDLRQVLEEPARRGFHLIAGVDFDGAPALAWVPAHDLLTRNFMAEKSN